VRARAILNRDGGTLKTEDVAAVGERIARAFEQAGRVAEIQVVSGADLIEALEKAQDSDVDAIVAGGGDGTVSAAAAAAWRGGKAFGVLPAGTMNLFARSLGLPLELDAAIDALARAEPAPVDIALADGRPFVQQFSVGMHAEMVAERETLEFASRLGKIWASVRAAGRVLARAPSIRAEIVVDGERAAARYNWIAVSNNPYGEGHMPYADRVDGGVLGVYRANGLRTRGAAALAADVMRGAFQGNADLRIDHARQVEIAFPSRKAKDRASLDGELEPLPEKVVLEILPGALLALKPLEATP